VSRVRLQVEYYFSEENLTKDSYLRCLMDADGWVPVMLLSTFPKVSQEGLELPQVVEALQHSTAVTVQGTAAAPQQALVRRATDYARWPVKGAVFIPTDNCADTPLEPDSVHDSGC